MKNFFLTNPDPQKHILEKNSKNIFIAIFDKTPKERIKIKFDFDYPKTELFFLGFILGEKDHSFNIEVIANHKAQNCKSDFHIYSVLSGKAQSDFKGILAISKKGKASKTSLEHHTILLSNKAKTRTQPALEIDIDEAFATHKTSTGKIDENMLFYLRSRGLNRFSARGKIIRAFMFQKLDKIPNAQTRKKLKKILKEKLQTQMKNICLLCKKTRKKKYLCN